MSYGGRGSEQLNQIKRKRAGKDLGRWPSMLTQHFISFPLCSFCIIPSDDTKGDSVRAEAAGKR